MPNFVRGIGGPLPRTVRGFGGPLPAFVRGFGGFYPTHGETRRGQMHRNFVPGLNPGADVGQWTPRVSGAVGAYPAEFSRVRGMGESRLYATTSRSGIYGVGFSPMYVINATPFGATYRWIFGSDEMASAPGTPGVAPRPSAVTTFASEAGKGVGSAFMWAAILGVGYLIFRTELTKRFLK